MPLNKSIELCALDKSDIKTFLDEFILEVQSALIEAESPRRLIDAESAIQVAAKLSHPNSIKENAFINLLLMDPLARVVQKKLDISYELVRNILRAESYRHYPDLIGTKCARPNSHPFSKKYGETSKQTLSRWRGEVEKQNPVLRAWPDFSLAGPFNIVFEAKYFVGKRGAAESEIVNGLYETFYYLSMPESPAAGRYPEWSYYYACYIALDASDGKELKSAWESLHQSVRDSFWTDANIFVAIL